MKRARSGSDDDAEAPAGKRAAVAIAPGTGHAAATGRAPATVAAAATAVTETAAATAEHACSFLLNALAREPGLFDAIVVGNLAVKDLAHVFCTNRALRDIFVKDTLDAAARGGGGVTLTPASIGGVFTVLKGEKRTLFATAPQREQVIRLVCAGGVHEDRDVRRKACECFAVGIATAEPFFEEFYASLAAHMPAFRALTQRALEGDALASGANVLCQWTNLVLVELARKEAGELCNGYTEAAMPFLVRLVTTHALVAMDADFGAHMRGLALLVDPAFCFGYHCCEDGHYRPSVTPVNVARGGLGRAREVPTRSKHSLALVAQMCLTALADMTKDGLLAAVMPTVEAQFLMAPQEEGGDGEDEDESGPLGWRRRAAAITAFGAALGGRPSFHGWGEYETCGATRAALAPHVGAMWPALLRAMTQDARPHVRVAAALCVRRILRIFHSQIGAGIAVAPPPNEDGVAAELDRLLEPLRSLRPDRIAPLAAALLTALDDKEPRVVAVAATVVHALFEAFNDRSLLMPEMFDLEERLSPVIAKFATKLFAKLEVVDATTKEFMQRALAACFRNCSPDMAPRVVEYLPQICGRLERLFPRSDDLCPDAEDLAVVLMSCIGYILIKIAPEPSEDNNLLKENHALGDRIMRVVVNVLRFRSSSGDALRACCEHAIIVALEVLGHTEDRAVAPHIVQPDVLRFFKPPCNLLEDVLSYIPTTEKGSMGINRMLDWLIADARLEAPQRNKLLDFILASLKDGNWAKLAVNRLPASVISLITDLIHEHPEHPATVWMCERNLGGVEALVNRVMPTLSEWAQAAPPDEDEISKDPERAEMWVDELRASIVHCFRQLIKHATPPYRTNVDEASRIALFEQHLRSPIIPLLEKIAASAESDLNLPYSSWSAVELCREAVERVSPKMRRHFDCPWARRLVKQCYVRSAAMDGGEHEMCKTVCEAACPVLFGCALVAGGGADVTGASGVITESERAEAAAEVAARREAEEGWMPETDDSGDDGDDFAEEQPVPPHG